MLKILKDWTVLALISALWLLTFYTLVHRLAYAIGAYGVSGQEILAEKIC